MEMNFADEIDALKVQIHRARLLPHCKPSDSPMTFVIPPGYRRIAAPGSDS
jgi:hypothetical protein